MTTPTLFLRQSILNSRRTIHSSSPRRASSSPQRRAAAAHKLDAVPLKKFTDIPGPLALPMLRHSAHVLPRIGSFHHSVGLGLLEGMRARYGDLVRLAKGSRARPVLYVFDPQIMREVYESRATHTPSWEQSPLNRQRQKAAGQCPFHRNDENAIWAGIQILFIDRNIKKIYEKAFNDIAADFSHRLEQLRSNENTLNEELETEIYRWAIETIGVMMLGIRMGCLDGPVHFTKECKQSHTNLEDVTHQCSLSSRQPADLSIAERFVQISKQIAEKSYLVRSEDTLKCDSETFNGALKAFYEHYCLTEEFLRIAMDNLSDNGSKEQMLLKKLRPLNERLLPLAADAFLAGVEPLAQTALSTLYHLSLNPAQQQRAHDEIVWFHSHEVTSTNDNTSTKDQTSSTNASHPSTNETNSSTKDRNVPPKDSIRDDLELSYIRGCGKEAMRLQPVTGGIIRRSFEEFSVRGYLVPEGVDIVLAHGVSSKEETQWGRAKAFIPERWCDQDWGPLKSTRAHPLASMPFGEKCPMAEISENILSSLMVKVLEKYRLEWHGVSPNMVTTGVNKLQGPFYFVLQNAH